MERRFYFDLETTGLYPRTHGVIQLAGLLDIDGQVVETINLRIRPFHHDAVSKEALQVNGITLDQIHSDPAYLPPTEAHRQLTDWMSGYVDRFDKKDKLLMVGYNSHAFDSPFLREWFFKCKDKFFGSYFWHPSIDVMLIAAYYLREVRPHMPNFKLATVCRKLNIPWDEDEAHDALYDVTQTRKLMLALELGQIPGGR